MEMKREIMPLYTNILVRPYAENPYADLVTKSGLVLSNGEFDDTDSGNQDKLELFIVCGQIVEIGPDVKFVKKGDDVFFDRRSCRPVPFMRQGFIFMAEQNVLCVMNDDLEERFNTK